MDQFTHIAYTLNWLRPHQALDNVKCRIGNEWDGGYVMMQDFRTVQGVYSLGIGSDVAFDLWFARQGVPVYQYDGSIQQPPLDHYKFSFLAKNIHSNTGMSILEEHDQINNHNLILKCDIEGAEWDWMDNLDPAFFSRFQQMVVEFHELDRLIYPEVCDRAFRVWEKINRTHAVIHVHGNNNGNPIPFGGGQISPTLEVSYVRRDRARLVPSAETFPTSLDRANARGWPDIDLGTFTFV